MRQTPDDPRRRRQQANASGRRKASSSPHSQNSRSRADRQAARTRIYRKSARYRAVRRQKMILTGIAGILLLLILLLVFRSCSGCGSPSATSAKVPDSDGTSVLSPEDAESYVTPEPTDPPMEPVTLTVSVVGDCTLGTDEYFDYDTSLNAYFDSYGEEYFMQNVRPIFSADDLTIANFEGVLTTSDSREEKQFAFKAPPEFAGILSSSSVEAVTTANNHSHDYGESSYTDTLQALKAKGIVTFGYDETAVMDVKGIKVGLVGIYELNDHLGRTEQLKANIARVKAEGAQLVIVIFHWGNEKEQVPDSNQMTLGRLAIDEGADLVCGHHPHVLQGIETYKGKNIVYSLGNFCFGGNSSPSDMDSMIFQQTFTIDENGVKADNITNIIPCSISSEYGYNNYQPTPAEGSEAERILSKIQERSSWIPSAETSSAS